MTGRDPRLLDSVGAWQLANSELLSAVGVESTVVGPTVDRNKNSATVELISSRLLVAVTIWDSGECEVIEASTELDESEPVVEVFELTDAAAVFDLLDRIGIKLKGRE